MRSVLILRTWIFLFSFSVFAANPNSSKKCATQLVELEKIRQKIALKNPDVSSLKISFRDFPNGEGFLESIVVSDRPNHQIAHLDYYIKDEAFHLNVTVQSNFREFGLNSLLMKELVALHPEVHQISSEFHEFNEAAFVVGLNLEETGEELKKGVKNYLTHPGYKKEASNILNDELLETSTPEDVIDYRKRAIKAYQNTPASKAYSGVGFNDIGEIKIELRDRQKDESVYVSGTVSKSNFKGDDQVRLIIKDIYNGKLRTREFLPSGEIKEIK